MMICVKTAAAQKNSTTPMHKPLERNQFGPGQKGLICRSLIAGNSSRKSAGRR